MLRPYHLSAYAAPLGLPLESNHMWRTILSFTYGSSYDCSIWLDSIAFDLISNALALLGRMEARVVSKLKCPLFGASDLSGLG